MRLGLRLGQSSSHGIYSPVTGNLIADPRSLNTANWVPAGSTAIPVVTANAAPAPDGSATAEKIVLPAVSGAGANALVHSLSLTPLAVAPYTDSIWLRGETGGEVVWLSTTPNGIAYFRVQATLTTSWRKYSHTFTPTAAGWYYQIGVDLRDASQTAKGAQTLYAWQAERIRA